MRFPDNFGISAAGFGLILVIGGLWVIVTRQFYIGPRRLNNSVRFGKPAQLIGAVMSLSGLAAMISGWFAWKGLIANDALFITWIAILILYTITTGIILRKTKGNTER
jgi:hypothetical protein